MGLFKDLYNSLNTDKGGFSLRKLAAMMGLITCMIVTHRYTTPSNLEAILIPWLLFVLLALGLVTFGQLLTLKTGQTTSVSTTEKTTSETKTAAP